MPLDYFLRLLRNPAEPREVRFAAAKAASVFVHPQLQAIAMRNVGSDGNGPVDPHPHLR